MVILKSLDNNKRRMLLYKRAILDKFDVFVFIMSELVYFVLMFFNEEFKVLNMNYELIFVKKCLICIIVIIYVRYFFIGVSL